MATAYVLITCDLGFDVEIIDEIKQLEEVKEVNGIFWCLSYYCKARIR